MKRTGKIQASSANKPMTPLRGTKKSPVDPSNGNTGKTDGLGRANIKPGGGTVTTHRNGDFSSGGK